MVFYENKKDIPKYASPSREVNYKNLPSCYTFVSRGELFYDEALNYIKELKKSGIDAKVDVYDGNTHAFDMMLFWTKAAKMAKSKLLSEVEKYFK